MANLTDADKVLRNDTGKDIVTQLTAIKTAIENGGGGGGGASTVSQLTDVLLSSEIPDGDVLVRDNNLTGGKLWKNATITVELTQAEYNQLVKQSETDGCKHASIRLAFSCYELRVLVRILRVSALPFFYRSSHENLSIINFIPLAEITQSFPNSDLRAESIVLL